MVLRSGLADFTRAATRKEKVGAVDGDQRGGGGGNGRLGGLADAALQVQILRQHLDQAHDGKLLHREQAGQPFGRHGRAADAGEGCAGA
jgi:hypothetical protein